MAATPRKSAFKRPGWPPLDGVGTENCGVSGWKEKREGTGVGLKPGEWEKIRQTTAAATPRNPTHFWQGILSCSFFLSGFDPIRRARHSGDTLVAFCPPSRLRGYRRERITAKLLSTEARLSKKLFNASTTEAFGFEVFVSGLWKWWSSWIW